MNKKVMIAFVLAIGAFFLCFGTVDVFAEDADFKSNEGEWTEISISSEEVQRLFASLSETPLMAASGAGAWEGRLKINPDGSFTGYYYDADAGEEVVYEVSFSGNFIASRTERRGDTTYGLWVENLKTQQTPGTKAVSVYGDRIVYDKAPIEDRDYLLLTLPGTDSDAIPEMVRGEIGGTFGEWEDYSRFITLTRRDDGWGFFADPNDPPAYDLEPIPTTESSADPDADPTPQNEAPTAAPTEIPDPAYRTDGLAGYWMAHDDSLAELIITDNGNGTLQAKAMFLPAADFEAVLTPQADGSMRFVTQYDHLVGVLSPRADGSLHLDITGGTIMEDEEATEYQGYYARGFDFYPADYEEMWYQTPEDALGSNDDWLGDWTGLNADGASSLHISRGNGEMSVEITLGRYRFSSLADMESDTVISVSDEDDSFYCMLVLNRKLKRIAMLEVGSDIEEVYDLAGSPYYGVLLYEKGQDFSDSPDFTDTLSDVETPQETAVPVITQSPQAGTLLPIPGRTDYLQVPISGLDATSYIVGKDDPSAYAPFRMTDGEETTAFQFSTKTTPLGKSYLYFDFDGPVTVDEMWIKNGFWKKTDGKDQYTRNSRVKKMTIYVRYEGSDDYQMLKEVTLKDDKARKDWKMINMPGAQNITGVRIRIDKIYKGTKFPKDVCISEIMFVKAADP